MKACKFSKLDAVLHQVEQVNAKYCDGSMDEEKIASTFVMHKRFLAIAH